MRRYSFLLIGGSALVALVAVLKLGGLPQIQFLVILCLTFVYLAWAIGYHFLDKSLKLEILLEYILTALLALVVAYGMLL